MKSYAKPTKITVVFLGYGILSIWEIALLFVSHIIFRQTRICFMVGNQIMQSKDSESKWLSIVANQIFHIIILGAITHISF